MKKGQAIVEVMLAFAVAVVALVGLVQVATRSVSNSGLAGRQSIASTYSAQGMEWIRGQRDTMGWGKFYPAIGTRCLNSFPIPPADITSIPVSGCGASKIGTTEFARTMTLSQIAGPPQQVQATVTVSWNEGTRVVSATQTTLFSSY